MRFYGFVAKFIVRKKTSKKIPKEKVTIDQELTFSSSKEKEATIKQELTSQQPIIKWLSAEKKFKSPLTELGIEPNSEFEEDDDSVRSNLKLVLILTMSLLSLGSYVILTLGGPEKDENDNPLEDEFSKLPQWKQYIQRTIKELDYYSMLVRKPERLRVKLLPDRLGFPYAEPKYTLVIELTDVLVHPEWSYSTGWQFKIRPGLQFLFDTLRNFYEIVIYVSEPDVTILPIVEAIDPNHIVAYKLVRTGSIFSGGLGIESLDNLNRDLSKVIIANWNLDGMKGSSDNMLKVKRWLGDEDDMYLMDLAFFLKTVADNDIDDVREVLKHYSKFDDPITVFRNNQKKYIDHLEQLAAQERKRIKNQKGGFWLLKFFRGD